MCSEFRNLRWGYRLDPSEPQLLCLKGTLRTHILLGGATSVEGLAQDWAVSRPPGGVLLLHMAFAFLIDSLPCLHYITWKEALLILDVTYHEG